jgi:hypothetical protein
MTEHRVARRRLERHIGVGKSHAIRRTNRIIIVDECSVDQRQPDSVAAGRERARLELDVGRDRRRLTAKPVACTTARQRNRQSMRCGVALQHQKQAIRMNWRGETDVAQLDHNRNRCRQWSTAREHFVHTISLISDCTHIHQPAWNINRI